MSEPLCAAVGCACGGDLVVESRRRTAREASTKRVLNQVFSERLRQDRKWGEQNHPDGTGRRFDVIFADAVKAETDANAVSGSLSWRDVLKEEVFEAFAEADPVALRAELVQVAAVAAAWVEALDRRSERGA